MLHISEIKASRCNGYIFPWVTMVITNQKNVSSVLSCVQQICNILLPSIAVFFCSSGHIKLALGNYTIICQSHFLRTRDLSSEQKEPRHTFSFFASD
ncbi:hypothetical protein XELAEV_18032309mg [Xenopus laevis]|uniref:Uncharacterized protein n=1 Tax=Xenopus laevis TaxID=8355 RepID=A0A974CQH7_XENLA|nr:hypothetical protein XELAEV_18032309mg [Xenopus laevis]